MGIDIPNIRTIIHFGSCEDIDTYLGIVNFQLIQRHDVIHYDLQINVILIIFLLQVSSLLCMIANYYIV